MPNASDRRMLDPVRIPPAPNKASITVYTLTGKSVSWKPIIPDPDLGFRVLQTQLVRFDAYGTLAENLAEALAIVPAILPEGIYQLSNWGTVITTVSVHRDVTAWEEDWSYEYV